MSECIHKILNDIINLKDDIKFNYNIVLEKLIDRYNEIIENKKVLTQILLQSHKE